MIELRPYQADLVDKTREAMLAGHRSILLVAPTGAGKTVMFSHFTASAVAKKNRVLVLAHREELLDQISQTLSAFKVPHSFIASNRHYDPRFPVQVGSVFTVLNRLHKIHKPDFVICDEAHHCAAQTSWGRVIRSFATWTIGVTASPCRLSGEPLGDVFSHMIVGPTVRELIDAGSLCDYRYFAPTTVSMDGVQIRMGDFIKSQSLAAVDKPQITGDAIREYLRLASGRRVAVFCISIEHAKNVAKQFADAGIPSASIDGKMELSDRRRRVADFRSGLIKVVTNCNIITEGFDLPALEGVIQLRPTASTSLYLQIVGRSLRLFPGKDRAIVLDHVGNLSRHGMPCDEREWSLTSAIRPKKKSTDSYESIKICPACFAAQPAGLPACVYCNHVFESKPRDIETVEGELAEIDPLAARRQRKIEQASSQTEEDLYRLGVARGYKHARRWAHHVFQSRQAKRFRGKA